MSELPNGWARARLDVLVDLNPKQNFDDELKAGFVPMSHAPTNFKDKLRFDVRNWGEIKKAYTNFKDGDVIFAKVTPCFENGKAALVNGLPNSIGAGSSEFFVLRPSSKEVSAQYILALIKSHDFMREGAANMTGAVGLRRVPRQFVEGYSVPLPPTAEQKRITQKLDDLLAQVDTLKARIDTIPGLLKKFRQSVLAAAVSGRLTKDWRKMQPDSALLDSAELPEGLKANWWPGGIPDGWQFEYYENIIDSRLGKMLDKAKNSGLPAPYLGNINVRWFKFDTDSLQEILINESERLELAVLNGDVLICEGGEPGRCAIWRGGKQVTVFQKALHRARTSPSILPEWLVFNIKNDADGNTLAQLFTGSTIKHLTGKALARYPLRLPPIAEQTEIVCRVEQIFAFADNLEAKVAAAKSRIDNLTQSILAKAFRGELVPQDPNDEPASVLLERIKAQRAATPKAKRSRKTSA